MNLYISGFRRNLIFFLLTIYSFAAAQSDSSVAGSADSSGNKLNMDAAYNRPFLINDRLPIAIGGYAEANTHYESTDGVSEGLSFQARRLTLFFSSTVARRIRFFSEIEFEDGTKEINIEAATLDLEFHSLLILRGGIVVNPIGAFNQNHDGPRYDFVDRPLSATELIPSTLSNAGFGLFGKLNTGIWTLGYEAYLTNGFDDKIIANVDNRTSLAAGKRDPERFEESNSGLPMFTGKLAVKKRNAGEIGISYMSGIYNKWREDGLLLDEKRGASVLAADFNFALGKRLNVFGEVVKIWVDVPSTYTQQYGSQQYGGFIDLVATVLQKKVFDWDNSKVNAGVRLEYVDFNNDTFTETGGDIADDIWSVVPALSFRPTGQTVLRFNYRYQQQRDLLGNPASRTAVYQFGFSSYF